MVPFGGWDMPLQYASVLDEHRACRTGAVVFDVSHLGTVECSGPGAFELLQWLLTNDLRKIEPRPRAVHAPARSGRRARRRRHHRVVGRRRSLLRDAERVEHRRAARRVRRRASRTPTARSSSPTSPRPARCWRCRVREARAPAGRGRARRPRRCRASRCARVGDLVVAGTGYTGEDGVELHVAAADAPGLWDALVRGRDRTRRARRPRHAAPRSGSAVARPRARARDHAAAGRARLGRRLGQGRLPGPRAARGRARARDRAAAARARRSRAGARRARARGCCATAPTSAWSRAATSRRCSGTASRSRSFRPSCSPATRCRSTCAASCSTASSSRCRSSPGDAMHGRPTIS